MKTTTIILSVLLLIAIGFVAWRLIGLTSTTNLANVNYDNFAKCITEKGVAMYGAEWCGHCQNQKQMFGTSFQYVKYIECAEGEGQAKVCTDKGITGYPTWEINGELIPGEQTFDSLSLKTGCKV